MASERSTERSISRRHLLKSGAASAVSVAALTTLANGCGGSTTPSAPDSGVCECPPVDAGVCAPVDAGTTTVDCAAVKGLPTLKSVSVSQSLTADVVVIGGGASGCSAAMRAAEAGAKVILVEKTGTLGGCFNLSWAATTYGSKLAVGKPDGFSIPDVDAFITKWVADSHWRCDASAVRQLMMNSGQAYDWLDAKGLGLIPLGWANGLMMLPDYSVRSKFWKDNVTAALTANGGQVLLHTTAASLEHANGQVTGAIVQSSDGVGTRITCKAVCISTGGYAGNKEMVQAANGFAGVNGSLPQNLGEGLAMAWDAGAWKPDNFGGQMLHQTLSRSTAALTGVFDAFPAKYPMIMAYLPMILNVSASGVRFRDEALILDPVAAANSSAYQGPFHYIVCSKKILDTLQTSGLKAIGQTALPGLPPEFQPTYTVDTPWANVYGVLDKVVELGFGFKGSTPTELATNAKLDVGLFTQTYSNYLQFCQAKADTQFNKAAAYLQDYGSDGPIYALACEVNNLGSFGGIQTSTRYEALDANKLPVRGLYATGAECGSNLYNDMYVGFGIGLANTVTSGYLCGKAMADYVKA